MRSLAAIGALAIIAAIGAAVFFFGGFYNVAATQPDLDVVAWAMKNVRDASIDRHAKDSPTSRWRTPPIVQAGARAFATRGCVNCHGGPAPPGPNFPKACIPIRPISRISPASSPPSQMFFVIKNGINMTGMPAFAPSKWATRKSGPSSPSSRSCRPSARRTTRAGPKPPQARPPRRNSVVASSVIPGRAPSREPGIQAAVQAARSSGFRVRARARPGMTAPVTRPGRRLRRSRRGDRPPGSPRRCARGEPSASVPTGAIACWCFRATSR